jgi:hypothetical protein
VDGEGGDDKQLVFSELSLLDLCPNSGEVRDDDDCEEVCLVHWVRQDRGDTDMEGEEVLILKQFKMFYCMYCKQLDYGKIVIILK